MDSETFLVCASPQFEADLDVAVVHAMTSSGRGAALRLLDSYETVCERLASFPCYGPRIADTGRRWCQVDRYVAIYRVIKQRHLVELLRLYYMNSNWKEVILEDAS